MFYRRITESENAIINALNDSEIGISGIAAAHLNIRQRFDLLKMDLTVVTGNDIIANIFVSHLGRVVRDRAAQSRDHAAVADNAYCLGVVCLKGLTHLSIRFELR